MQWVCCESLDLGTNDCFYLCHSTSVLCGLCPGSERLAAGSGTYTSPAGGRWGVALSRRPIKPGAAQRLQSPLTHHQRQCSPARLPDPRPGGAGVANQMGQKPRSCAPRVLGHSPLHPAPQNALQPASRRDGPPRRTHIAWSNYRSASQHGLRGSTYNYVLL